ncbi:hypothetical protein QCD85_10010 [Paenibacillus sp. PsM32]|uniref:hypothetical protein n=1 Tax=unclassified Paenibacillus TaxID=185978 RepID=UPI0023661D2D|nr:MULTISPECIES: hypothetical protein [unclassified Paenibacillus]MDN4618431.1 hypothetical protein [Paenibacillus sp. PsM32]WDF52932.1 hypothetical protein PQ460_11105 [Paenibacillus sp. KACC 21273]
MGYKTEVTKYGAIDIESGGLIDWSHEEILKFYARPALDYISRILGAKIKDINARLIFSEYFYEDLKKIHQAKIDSNNAPNATYIPIEEQSEKYRQQNQHIILINMQKLGFYSGSDGTIFIRSVVIHELVHLCDFSIQFPTLKERILENSGNVTSKLYMCIYGYFQYYLEFRAKYHQEYYFCGRIYIHPLHDARMQELLKSCEEQIAVGEKSSDELDEIEPTAVFENISIPDNLESYILQRICLNEKFGIEYSLSHVLGSFLAFERLAAHHKWTNLAQFIEEKRRNFNDQHQTIMDQYFCSYKDLLKESDFFDFCMSFIEHYK